MKKACIFAAVLVFVCYGAASAHFGMLIPGKATVSKSDPKTLELQVSFSHPFEMVGMDMANQSSSAS